MTGESKRKKEKGVRESMASVSLSLLLQGATGVTAVTALNTLSEGLFLLQMIGTKTETEIWGEDGGEGEMNTSTSDRAMGRLRPREAMYENV